MERWLELRFCRIKSSKEAKFVLAAFLTVRSGKQRLLIEENEVKKSLEYRTLRMEKLKDAEIFLCRDDSIFKADVKDA